MTSYDFNLETNKSLCGKPFTHSASTATGEQVLCCRSRPSLSQYKTVDEYWNSKQMSDIRLKMLAGEKINHCQSCYDEEEQGIESMRQTSFVDNIIIGGSPSRYDSIESFMSKFSAEELETGILKHNPIDFDYRQLHCNLACHTCNSGSSTSWSKKITDYEKSQNINHAWRWLPRPNVEFEMRQADDIIKAIDNRTLTNLYWAGGEPLMSPMHWKVMDYLIELIEIDPDYVDTVMINYNTNFSRTSWKGEPIYKQLAKFKNICLSASIDGVGDTYNYIRHLGDWGKVSHNLEMWYKETDLLHIMPVMTNLWILDAPRFFDYFKSLCQSNGLSLESVHFTLIQLLQAQDIKRTLAPKQSHPSTVTGLHFNQSAVTMSPYWFPKEIMIPAIDTALERLSDFPTGSNRASWLTIMRNELEKNNNEISNREAPGMKKYLSFFDAQRKDGLSFGSVLKEINTEAWMWYNSI